MITCEKNLIARRMVYDAIATAGGVNKVKVSQPLILSARNARGRYQQALEQKAKQRKDDASKAFRKRIAPRELKELQTKRAKLSETVQSQLSAIDEQIEELKQSINVWHGSFNTLYLVQVVP